jgi:fatty-acyl-CoA synthase
MSDISRWIAGHVATQPDKPAIRSDDRTLSYGEFDRLITCAAGYLSRDLRLARGDTIAWYGQNSEVQIIVTFAAARLGLMLTPLNWRLAAPELRYILEDAQVRVVFHSSDYADAVRGILPAGDVCQAIAGKVLLQDHGIEHAPSAGRAHDPLLLVYTSGTTGQPKGAVLTQHAVEMNALNAIDMHDMTADDHILTVLPMFHVGGLNIQTLPALRCGATVSLHARFDPARTLNAIGENQATLTCLVPATIQAMMRLPEWEHADVSSLRAVATGSTNVPLDVIETFQSRGVPVIQVYGSTETGPVCLYQRPCDAFETTGSIGRCGRHSEIRLVDADDRDVAIGEPGEILVRGGNVASGYWRDVAQSEIAFRNGWFHSGDIAVVDENGQYWFKDRLKHVIISGGENIYPAELERVLRTIPGIREAAVVGCDDGRWGQVPVAAVVCKDQPISESDVRAAFDGQLARYKHPKAVVFLDALPRNGMGKVVPEAVKVLVERELK